MKTHNFIMESSLEKHVQEKVETDITSGNLQAIRDLCQSTDPEKQPSLLAHIVARAAGKAQLDILDWLCSEGFQIAPGFVNNEFYHQACYAQPLTIWKTLVVGDGLSLAAYYGNVEIARFLLEKGQDTNEAMEALELLVEHGADLEEASGLWTNCGIVEADRWSTVLYRATYMGQREPVVHLLGKGANVHFRDKMGRSILWAAKQGGK
ncbi:hypothetical protein ASPACDRAFT_1882848 [Aspergillus aculeatus ATCC 16872]|uniref:Uncharacterized protein n=1 Tax=Aspergillus aculeatus (strain ATCC 16872 / CBS 172.66 / WB 5094) TaxID=690307 RepID=A0A1L9WK60_ASPA1|nr:uncharacterized protein ASPACDRAFT_1882848 [Aspergillus aculeatus ATCC 16872]OJJ96555.1 hypothetical protein ASPACDRAFT_1882848 [Aspergillus aculeatus ATCC 16872]